MTQQASDVLAVELLQKACGVARPLRVVPLFETAADLRARRRRPRRRSRDRRVSRAHQRPPGGDGRLLRLGEGRRTPQRRAGSCSRRRRHRRHLPRDTGSASRCFTGAAAVSAAAAAHVSRAAVAAPGIDRRQLRVTEQGEMIQALFGLPDIALRTLEVYTSGTLESWLAPPSPPRANGGTAWIACRTTPAPLSRLRLRQSARSSTTSTPRRRRRSLPTQHRQPAGAPQAGGGLESLRAIPWQFAWTQTRLLLGIWLGLEEAFERAFARGERELLQTMYREWPHFRSVIDLFEMVLAKSGRAHRRRVRSPARARAAAAARRRASRSAGARHRRAAGGHRSPTSCWKKSGLSPLDRRAQSLRRSDQPGADRSAAPASPGDDDPRLRDASRDGERHRRRDEEYGIKALGSGLYALGRYFASQSPSGCTSAMTFFTAATAFRDANVAPGSIVRPA